MVVDPNAECLATVESTPRLPPLPRARSDTFGRRLRHGIQNLMELSAPLRVLSTVFRRELWGGRRTVCTKWGRVTYSYCQQV